MVEVLLKNKQKLYISSFYHPPSRCSAQLELFEESLCDIAGRCKNNPNHIINIGGDFNARDINWDSMCAVSGSSQKDVNDMLLRILGDFNLTQTESQLATLASLTCSLQATQASTHVIPGDSHHEVVISDNYIMPVCTKKKSRKIFLYSKANWDDIKTATTRFAIDSVFNTTLESKRSDLKSHTDRVTECFVPSKMTSKRHNVPWMNRSLRCLCRKKNRFYKKGRRSGSPSSWTRYKESKTAVTKSLREARNNYIGSIINTAFRDNDTKLFWRFIKSQVTV